MTVCPSCGHDNAASAKFCSECGTKLGQATAPARTERKIVTVLFADLVGFTAQAERKLQVRIGVNTGEALVNLGARPEAGEGMAAGDVVNTAARLQTAAAPNGILAGETTYRATQQTIDYSDAQTIEAKGKEDALRVYE